MGICILCQKYHCQEKFIAEIRSLHSVMHWKPLGTSSCLWSSSFLCCKPERSIAAHPIKHLFSSSVPAPAAGTSISETTLAGVVSRPEAGLRTVMLAGVPAEKSQVQQPGVAFDLGYTKTQGTQTQLRACTPKTGKHRHQVSITLSPGGETIWETVCLGPAP